MPGSGLGKDRPRRTTEHYYSAETAKTIPAGSPVVLNAAGNGGSVVAPSSAASAAVAAQLIAGVAVRDIPPGGIGEFVVNGHVEELRVIRATRASSTAGYASYAAIAIGDKLDVNTVGDGLERSTAAATGDIHPFIALETAASAASAASNSDDSSTAIVTKLRGFVRLM
jgi:hypothetical protein